MASNNGNGVHVSPIASGGASIALDLKTEADRGALRTAIKRWPKRYRAITPEFADQLVHQLEEAMEEVSDIEDIAKRVDARTSIARTGAMMIGQEQKDDHAEAGVGDNGTTNIHIGDKVLVVPPPVRARINE